MKFNEKLLDLRKKKGWSQEELAYKLDVSRQTISNWELGETAPNPEQLIMLSSVFEKSIDELVGNEIKIETKEAAANIIDTKTIKLIYIKHFQK